jgi:hypothetical protein
LKEVRISRGEMALYVYLREYIEMWRWEKGIPGKEHSLNKVRQ